MVHAIIAIYWLFVVMLLRITPALAGFRFTTGGSFDMPKEDPYKVLGISRRANEDVIKKAYRQMAKEAHPDKNPDLDPDMAAENFRRIVDAFDLLSDPQKRKQYDARYYQQQRQQQQQAQRMEQQRRERERVKRQKEQEERRQKEQLLAKARDAQSHMKQYSTLDQLKSELLDKNGVFKRHFLCAFVANKKAEKFTLDELLFPLPFAGRDENNVPWNNIIQTAKVRYNKRTPLTDFFHANSAANVYIVFGKKGDPIKGYKVFSPSNMLKNQRAHFEAWVKKQLTANIRFLNRHVARIALYRVNGRQMLPLGGGLDSNYEITLSLKSGDHVVAVDSRLDSYPGSNKSYLNNYDNFANAVLGRYTISSDETIEIHPKRCVDMSARCLSWVNHHDFDVCTENAEFMHNICPATCEVCRDHMLSGISYYLFHYPLHWLPNGLSEIVHFLRVYKLDVEHVLSYRKNAAFVFFACGLFVGINFFLLRLDYTSRKRTQPTAVTLTWGDIILFNLLIMLGMASHWILTVRAAPSTGLSVFQADIRHLYDFHKDAIFCLLVFGAIIYQIFPLLYWAATDQPRNSSMNQERFVILLLTSMAILSSSFGIFFFIMIFDENHARQWHQLWMYRRNAIAAIFLLGFPCGALIGLVRRILSIVSGIALEIMIQTPLVGLVWYLISIDQSSQEDLRHVMELRKNVMFAFGVFGIIVGFLVINGICIVADTFEDKFSSKKYKKD